MELLEIKNLSKSYGNKTILKDINLKIVKSVLIGFLIYILLSLLSIGTLYILGLINPNIMTIFSSTVVDSNTLKTMMLIGIAIYAIYNIEIYFTGNILLNKGVDID